MNVVERDYFHAVNVPSGVVSAFFRSGFCVAQYDSQDGYFLRKAFSSKDKAFSKLIDHLDDSQGHAPQNIVVEICPDGTLQVADVDYVGSFTKFSTEDCDNWIALANDAGVTRFKWHKELFSLDVKTSEQEGFKNVGYNLPLVDIKKLSNSIKNSVPLSEHRHLTFRVFDSKGLLVLIGRLLDSRVNIQWNKGAEISRMEMLARNHKTPNKCSCGTDKSVELQLSPEVGFSLICPSDSCSAQSFDESIDKCFAQWNALCRKGRQEATS